MTHYIPYVYEREGTTEKTFDLYSRLMKERIIFIGTAIDDSVANAVVAQLLFLQMDDPKKDIHLYINSPGGSVVSGMAIYDTMKLIKPDVNTYCVGMAASMGAVLLSGGTKGKRAILPHGQVMIHQPLGGAQGQASDIIIAADQIMKWKSVLCGLLAKNTGNPLEQVTNDSDRDYWMDAQQALEYGIADKILGGKQ